MTKPSHKLIPATEAADRLGVSRRTVLRLVDSGHLIPAIKAPGLRGAYVFTEDEVARVKQQRERAPAA